jgi:hypothetical protein
MTRIQKLTVGLIVAYLIWELIVFLSSKKQAGPVIRADLLVIYPVLLILIIISVIQWLKGRS